MVSLAMTIGMSSSVHACIVVNKHGSQRRCIPPTTLQSTSSRLQCYEVHWSRGSAHAHSLPLQPGGDDGSTVYLFWLFRREDTRKFATPDGRPHCANAQCQIWSLDGRVVQVLDRSYTLPMALDPSGPDPDDITPSRVRPCVRDVSWHSQVSLPAVSYRVPGP